MPENSLIILRGLPGAGKSLVAELIGGEICCADDFFIADGEYKFDSNKIQLAHIYCQNKCRLLMAINKPKIIVANTSTSERELKPYFDMAKKYGYKVFSLIVENRHGNSNIHNVPEETIEKMKNRFNIKLI